MLNKGIIKFLSNNTIRKITAGELFYNPALIIKELLENSIDAKSKSVDIILINSGKNIIKILDDGIGMNKYDTSICFKRHTTSKIEKIEDLFTLKTNGFRGEALAAISAISQIEIISKDKNSDVGIHIFLDRGIITKYIPVQTNIGTTIIVKNIFFNIPIRRNLLKSDKIELCKIIDEFNIIALSNININIRLYNNNKLIYNLKKSFLKERILDIFLEKKDENLIPIFYKKDDLFIKGFISNISYCINNKYEQYIFINNKYISNKNLYKCISSAYSGLLKKNKYPFCVLFLYIKYEFLDININPDKKKIFIKNEKLVLNAIQISIKNVIFKKLIKIDMVNTNFNNKKNEKYSLEKENTNFNIKNNYLLNNKIYELDYNTIFNKKKIFITNSSIKTILNDEENNKSIQIYNKYIVTNYKSKLIIIDQHRAHQRILYEKLKKILVTNNFYSKKTFPIKILIYCINIQKLKLIIFELQKIGFEIKLYKLYIIIKSIPYFFSEKILILFFNKLFNDINIIKSNNFKKIILNNILKIISIKKGEILNAKQIKYIIKKLFICENSSISPFKKKIYFFLPINILDNILNK